MSIVFFGTPEFAVPSLRALHESGEDIRAVVTRPDKRRRRHSTPEPSDVKKAATELRMDVLEPISMKDTAFIGALKDISPEFIVVVAYGRILSREVLDVPSIAPVNLHASLLPKYRGASPIAWAIINGEMQTGLTTMLITMGLDEGDILLAQSHDIDNDDTTESLSRRLSNAGGQLLVETLRGLRSGTIVPKSQTGEATYAPILKKGDGRINWHMPAKKIYDFVRGMYPWPCAFADIGGQTVKIIKVKPLEGKAVAGRIVQSDNLIVGASDGLVIIEELKPQNGRLMSGSAYLRGRNDFRGLR